jgi:hypothetical protein
MLGNKSYRFASLLKLIQVLNILTIENSERLFYYANIINLYYEFNNTKFNNKE